MLSSWFGHHWRLSWIPLSDSMESIMSLNRLFLDNLVTMNRIINMFVKQVLPALHRALSLLGVDVYQWYNELPRVFQAPLPQLQEVTNRKLKVRICLQLSCLQMCCCLQGTLGQYFATMHCPICKELTTDNVCSRCRDNPQKVATILSQQIRDLELAHHSVTMVTQWNL